MPLAPPHRKNFPAKEDRLVLSGKACPGPPPGTHWCQAFLLQLMKSSLKICFDNQSFEV